MRQYFRKYITCLLNPTLGARGFSCAVSGFGQVLKGQCPDCAHARASSVFSSKDNRTVILTRQDFLFGTAPPTEICCLHSQVKF